MKFPSSKPRFDRTRLLVPRTDEELFVPKVESRPRIYAYSIADLAHSGQLKVGQTTQEVKARVAQQVKTAAITNFTIELDEFADREDGTIFTDHDVRARLKQKGFANPTLEWMKCGVDDVKTAIAELRAGMAFSGTHHLTFESRDEQKAAVDKTFDYFQSRWAEDVDAVPEFLWNAKMRFGKTFTAYQLAKRMNASRVLVVTFKPAVEDAWRTDLESHVDFDGWQYLSRSSGTAPNEADPERPLVYFGSFQDLLGRDAAGNFKARNSWLTDLGWDLVVFDEYHFGAWRDTAKELFEGEDDLSTKKGTALEFGKDLEIFAEELEELGSDEDKFVPIRAPTSISRALPSRLSPPVGL